MRVLRNVGLAATCRPEGDQANLHPVPDAALVWDDDQILWVGAERDLPSAFATQPSDDAGRRLLIPGLIDCHTHLAFGGWRADEFERRLRGESYLDIARNGGGIASTVRATRAAPFDDLVSRAQATLGEMARLGVTTVECKSGYGLSEEHELKLLEVYRALADAQPLRLAPTLLGAHVVPPEYAGCRDRYVDLLCNRLIPRVAAARLAVFCDVFVEDTAFTRDEARRVFHAAAAHGLRPKLHADQLHDGGGAALAAEVGAVSADHLEYVSADGITRLRDAEVVAVSLPIATLYLRTPPMPARSLIDAGVPVAVATDFNPGSAPSYHLPFALTLACTLQRMTPGEALKGATIVAARAIGLDAQIGSLEAGKSADFALIDAPDVAHWLYHLRANACTAAWVAGRRIF
jgi:imidazolonepropionase